jgi:hypothetical protein
MSNGRDSTRKWANFTQSFLGFRDDRLNHPPLNASTRAVRVPFRPAPAFHIAVRSSPQISLGGGVKANTLCAGNDAGRTLQSQQLASLCGQECAREIS